eukprot:646928-Prorocentrum_lima.AAC.1
MNLAHHVGQRQEQHGQTESQDHEVARGKENGQVLDMSLVGAGGGILRSRDKASDFVDLRLRDR